VTNLPSEKLKPLFGLRPKILEPVPELALEPSVNQTRASSGKAGSISPIIPVYNDIEDFGIIITWNSVVIPHIQNRVTHIFPDRYNPASVLRSAGCLSIAACRVPSSPPP